VDNVEPHEHHIIDKPCNHYYLGAVDGFVYMSEQVGGELKAYTSVPMIFSPHPMFENFGKAVERDEACEKLKLDPEQKYSLFFGLIRDYKGLDLLLEAWARWKPAGRKLLVAGEFYASREKTYELIEKLGLQDDVVMHEGFVADDDVRYYFSGADSLLLPYRTATQSGVTQIAYNFSMPMLVTGVGGLPEIVPDGRVGVVCEPSVDGILDGLHRLYADNELERMKANFAEERKRFSWATMCDKLLEVFNMAR
jgi:glycosyltransferase involved in cell wall biosynthesis